MTVIKLGELSRREWAKRLNGQWDQIRQTAVERFVQLGRDLVKAKFDLGKRGQWVDLVESDLKFNARIAQMFMRLATCIEQKRGIASYLKLLPPDYTTIDKLTRLDDPTFRRLIKDGTINPSVQRNEVAKLLRVLRVGADEQRVLDLVPVAGKFRTLVFDPAWDHGDLSIAARANPDYAKQSLESLRELDVRAWADESGCHLYCWTTNNFSYEAHKLVEHWGFQHRTILTWIKPPPFGLGSYLRNSTDQCLFATRGDTTTRHAAASIPTHFEAPRGEHSEKPEAFYEIVRAASYPPYGEANQREARPDFTNLFKPVSEAAE